jgi:hypothetical protein
MARDESEMDQNLAAYLAGIFDGDGSVGMLRSRWPDISVSQAHSDGPAPELAQFVANFGGRIVSKKRNRSESAKKFRQLWQWTCPSVNVEKFCEVIEPFSIMKRPQLAAVLAFSRAAAINPTTTEQRDSLWEELKRMKSDYANVVIDDARLTPQYIAGFFAAEGSLGIYSCKKGTGFRPMVTITQVLCPRITEAIQRKLGYGLAYTGRWQVTGFHFPTFLSLLEPHLSYGSQKLSQVKLAREIYHTRLAGKAGVKRSASEREEIVQQIEKLKQLKKM